ncbi:MAG: glucose-6-phosphate isomerase [Ruminococcaceae bacterium]|nr:glucose-6-phosphate isomerase [Oscillospiraceae bacterium]
MSISLSAKHTEAFIAPHELEGLTAQLSAAIELVESKSGLGNDFLGWVDLPVNYDKEEVSRIKAAAERIRNNSDIFICIGIGGSYLGARAVIELLKGPMHNTTGSTTPQIYFAGNNIDPEYLSSLLAICEGKDITVNVISKSGTTTEPAIAFRVFSELLRNKYGAEGAKDRIFVTTDRQKGTLKALADKEGYETFVVPDDIGGRFSVLTAVGLLPIAVAGIDLDGLFAGAQAARKELSLPGNDCYRYAALRNILYRKGKSIELLASFSTAFGQFSEWWKQLYGESEGKDGKGLFPASVTYSTDLHSLGQFVQQGSRNLFETMLWIEKPVADLTIGIDPENTDGLNFLAGKQVSEVNLAAFRGTVLAHNEGGVPCILLSIPAVNEYEVGYLIYFFEKACAVSGYMLGVNPFDQPGVEAYKKNMFALLGKPGFEDRQQELLAKLD